MNSLAGFASWARRLWPATVLTLVLVIQESLRAAESQGSVSNAAPAEVLRVAVLPFLNATGDAAWDDWQYAFPGFLRVSLSALGSFDALSEQTIRPALKRAAWKPEFGDTKRIREATAELEAEVVVWGSFSRQTNAWVVAVKLLRDDADPAEFHLASSNWMDAAESMAELVAKHLGAAMAERDREYWRAMTASSPDAATLLAKASALRAIDAPAAVQQRVLREALQIDKRCALAYGRLLELLWDEKQLDDYGKLALDFLRERPDVCQAHLSMAEFLRRKESKEDMERELRAALRAHPGCPGAAANLSMLLGSQKRVAEARNVLEAAFQERPRELGLRILLAHARAVENDNDGAAGLLRPLRRLPPENLDLDEVLLKTTAWTRNFDLLGLELLRLGPRSLTNQQLRELIESMVLTPDKTNGAPMPPIARPRRFTPAELETALNRSLSPEERSVVVNPVEVTPALISEAQKLTAGLTNELTRVIALFSEVGRRGRGHDDAGRKTAEQTLPVSRKPGSRFICQEHAKLFVGLARAVGIDAWLVHIDRDAFGDPGYHDCAVAFLEGTGILIDPTWRTLAPRHQEFAVLDDVQAIAHHALQLTDERPDPRRLRAGLKLNPGDRWTRVQFVCGMAKVGDYEAARLELSKLQSGPQTWDVHVAEASLHAAQGRWQAALDALQRALALSPSNAAVQFRMAEAYDHLGDHLQSGKHLEAALRLDRGEIPQRFRELAPLTLALAQANAQTRTGDQSTRLALVQRAEAGELAAQIALAQVCFDEGPARFAEGLRWLRKAAEQENAPAQMNYALNLIRVRGPEAGNEVVAWLTRAAEQGFGEAQSRLGLILYEAKLAPQDRVAAYSWTTLAAAQGDKEAKWLLKEIELFIRPDELAEARQRTAAFTPVKKPALPKP